MSRGLLLIVATFLFQGSLQAGAQGLDLKIVPEMVTAKKGEELRVRAYISNRTGGEVKLVLPGDGSDASMRTPITGWSILPVEPSGGNKPHPQSVSPRLRDYDDINPLYKSEIVVLKPSETVSISEWLQPPLDLPRGRYRAVFYYTNDPGKKLAGEPLGENEVGVEQLIATSTPCHLVSNEIVVTIE